MTKNILSLLLLLPLSFCFLSFGTLTSADDILGEWYTDGNESIIHIYKKGDLYYGNISWVIEPNDDSGAPKRDFRNPDPSKRDQLITEVVLLHHFKFDNKNAWLGGTIYNPEDGKDYSGKITLHDKNTLALRGYIGAPFLGRTVLWQRK